MLITLMLISDNCLLFSTREDLNQKLTYTLLWPLILDMPASIVGQQCSARGGGGANMNLHIFLHRECEALRMCASHSVNRSPVCIPSARPLPPPHGFTSLYNYCPEAAESLDHAPAHRWGIGEWLVGRWVGCLESKLFSKRKAGFFSPVFPEDGFIPGRTGRVAIFAGGSKHQTPNDLTPFCFF